MSPKSVSCPGCTSGRVSGFTLIELLTVIAIIGILAAIIIPTVGRVREKAKDMDCANRIRSWAVAANLYAAENKSRYVIKDTNGTLWCQISTNNTGGIYIPYFSKGATRTYDRTLMSCPSGQGQTEYDAATAGGTNTPTYFAYAIAQPHTNGVTIKESNGIFVPIGKARQPSRTILFIERSYQNGGSGGAFDTGPNATICMEGSQISAGYQAYSRHNKRIHTAFLDGHVTGMAWEDIDPNRSLTKGSGRSAGFNTDWLKLD